MLDSLQILCWTAFKVLSWAVLKISCLDYLAGDRKSCSPDYFQGAMMDYLKMLL